MTGKPNFRKPVPQGVVERTGLNGQGLVRLDDGSLMLIAVNDYYTSTDEGLNWSAARPLNCAALSGSGEQSCIRLQSGKLALAHRGAEEVGRGTEEFNWNPLYLSVSEDQGKTWAGARPMNLLGGPYHDTMIQLQSGRLLMPSRICHSNNQHAGLEYERVSSYGYWKGLRLQVSGHYHYPEIDIAAVSYSDDEGQTWQRCPGQLMGWFDAEGIPNGRGGVTAVDEPNVAECADGRLLLLARSTVGRLVQSYSEDEGVTWTPIVPSDLASSYSPPRLRRIPNSGDLLCVWNQVSRDEIKRGYRRGRLSVALSRDSGASWEQVKTIEVSAGLEDVDRLPPSHPITPVVALPELGTLPEGFSAFEYANAWFSGESVYLTYRRSWVDADERQETARRPGEVVLRIYPLEWFYDSAVPRL
jgi:hypothetical protein